MGRIWLIMGCVFCGLSVITGAFATHALKGTLDAESMVIFDIATRYMMFHGVGLLALGLWAHFEKWVSSFFAGSFFTLGILLFSGSLYILSFTEMPMIVYATPIGGVCFILGWISFMISVMRARNRFI